MLSNQRVIFSDNGTLYDISDEMNDYKSQTYTLPIVAAEDYIYIGSDLPFNHRYFDVSTANDQGSTVSVDIWWGNDWVSAVDLKDRTDSSTATLAQSGILSFSTNRLKGWDIEDDSADVTGLTGTAIYNMYWIRISFDSDLANTTALNYIGHKFSDDDDLYSLYPDLNNTSILAAFESGKTTWIEQHIVAAEYIITYLQSKSIIFSPSQILDWQRFMEPSIHKVAEIIYTAMGPAYAENRKMAENNFTKSINRKFYYTDTNANGNLEPVEKAVKQEFMIR